MLEHLERFFATDTGSGLKLGAAPYGIYAFYDYEGEPLYVGQSKDKDGSQTGGRIRRHLTGYRADSVALCAVDPIEVAHIEIWPFYDLLGAPMPRVKETLDAAEWLLYEELDQRASHGLLNFRKPGEPKPGRIQLVHSDLPRSFAGQILPDEIIERRSHPDVWLAQQVEVLARMTTIMSRRNTTRDTRRSCDRRVRRIAALSRRRFEECKGVDPKLASLGSTAPRGSSV